MRHQRRSARKQASSRPQKFSVRLTPQHLADLTKVAEANQRPLAFCIREAVQEYLSAHQLLIRSK